MEREKIHDMSFLDSLDIYVAFINNIYGWNHLHTNENVHLIFDEQKRRMFKNCYPTKLDILFSLIFLEIYLKII